MDKHARKRADYKARGWSQVAIWIPERHRGMLLQIAEHLRDTDHKAGQPKRLNSDPGH